MKTLKGVPNGMKKIKLEGNSYDIGFKHGKYLKESIRFNLSLIQNQGSKVWNGLSYVKSSQVITENTKFLKEFYPNYLDEMKGISDGSGLSFKKILKLNILPFDWLRTFGPEECTQLAVKNVKGQWILAKTRDLGTEMIHVLLDRSLENSKRTLEVGVAGSILWPGSGINENGLTVGSSGVWSRTMSINYEEANSHFILPSMHVILELCNGIRELRDCGAKYVPSLTGINMVAADTADAAAFEFGINNIVEFRARSEDTFLARTNHYIAKELTKWSPSPKENPSSYEREAFLDLTLPHFHFTSDEEILQVISSHNNFPQNSICRHKTGNGKGSQTIYGSISNPLERRLIVFNGNPCKWLNL